MDIAGTLAQEADECDELVAVELVFGGEGLEIGGGTFGSLGVQTFS